MNELPRRKGLPLVICAPSGAGKTTLVTKLRAEFPLDFSISCTTRAPRGNEKDGIDYIFLSKDEFRSRIDAGYFAEWAEVHGNYYGTPLKPVRDSLDAGRDILFDIDVQGAAQISLSLPEARFVFILPPSIGELERRLRGRGTDSDESVRLRLSHAASEIRESHWFDAVVVNDDLDAAYVRLRAFYLADTLQPSLNPALAQAVISV
ncbi:MAG: guanylate kinase [Mailhella sp.]|nr:guanylate kinase [Mailhella sp.]